MSIPLLVNGITYNYPTLDDEGWGPDASNWAVAITQNIIQKSGGLFSLTGDIDFGPNFGIKSVYYKTRSANIATAGNFRLANTDIITFRNAGNTGNLNLSTGSIDAIPAWNSIDLVNVSTAQTLFNKTFTSPLVNTNINLLNQGSVDLKDLTNTGTVSLRASNSQTNYTITLPANNPSPITFLKFDGTDYVWGTTSGFGTVTYVDMAVPSILTVSGNPITGSGTFTLGLANELANLVFAGPVSGIAASPSFRSLVVSDIPTLPLTTKVSGILPIANGGSGTDITNANLVFAGPVSGGAASPSFRSLVASDIPTLPILSIANGGTNAATKVAAFDNLSPISTMGDTIIGGISGTNTRLPIGPFEGQLLKVYGGIPAWQPDLPVAVIMPYAGIIAPGGWFLCDGRAISRTIYDSLFAVVGTTYGNGDGITTFNIPDLRGRAVIALDNMGGTSANRVVNPQGSILGGVLGTETHQLSTAELSAHNHSISASGSGSTSNTDLAHTHGQQNARSDQSGASTAVINDTGGDPAYTGCGPNYDSSSSASRLNTLGASISLSHSHPFSVSVSGTSGNTGSNTAHNNMQPTIALNYIIKSSYIVPLPIAPTNLTASVASSTSILLDWINVNTDYTNSLLERSTDGINFTQIQSLSAGVTTYTNISLTPGLTYYYRVRTQNTAGYSSYSNIESINLPDAGNPRAIIAGGLENGGGYYKSMDFIDISSTGNAANFGDLIIARYRTAAVGSKTRSVFIAGYDGINPSPNPLNSTIDYVTLATTGNATSFGYLNNGQYLSGSASSAIMGVTAGGFDNSLAVQTIYYVNIATTADATFFGDLSTLNYITGGMSSQTRGIFTGDVYETNSAIEYITFVSAGTAVNFGNVLIPRSAPGTASSKTLGIYAGGDIGFMSATANIEYITMATTADGTSFGNLTKSRNIPSGTSNSVTAIFSGCQTVFDNITDIEYVTIAPLSTSSFFGDLTVPRTQTGSISGSHGGI